MIEEPILTDSHLFAGPPVLPPPACVLSSTRTALTQEIVIDENADAPQADVYFPRGGHMHAEPGSERDTFALPQSLPTRGVARSESACRERVTT